MELNPTSGGVGDGGAPSGTRYTQTLDEFEVHTARPHFFRSLRSRRIWSLPRGVLERGETLS